MMKKESGDMHSKKFKKVKGYYDSGLWDIKKVRDAVIHGWIIAEEFEEITGQPYEEVGE
jgi:hypothetical protein